MMNILLLLFLVLLTTHTLSQKHAITKHKAPNSSTHPTIYNKWIEKDTSLHAYIAQHVPSILEHTGSEAFDAHLKGVQGLLRGWGAEDAVCDAGLFHSIYGTEGFQGFSLPLSERATIRRLIGAKAEKLCWIFCMVDRYTVDSTVFAWNPDTNNETFTFKSRPELGRFTITLTQNEWIDFIELTLADWLEQVQGAAEKPSSLFLWKKGEAYAYRREAYAKMATILRHVRKERLGEKVLAAMEDVYATESMETRNLVQERTPPMNDAARGAMDALRANGEEIPLVFAPIPRESSDLLDRLECEDTTNKECTHY